MLPWLFALNHTNYARWIPVHLRDMRSLSQIAPDVAVEFEQGSFTVRKSTRAFSAIAIDHAHEQNNASVKGDGGAVGLTENPGALRRWMTSGPETARLVNEFELNQQDDQSTHHEVQQSFQTSFGNDVKSLVATFEDLGNPFLDQGDDLVVLDTKEVAPPDALERLKNIESVGNTQCEKFVSERLEERAKSLFDPIKRNKLNLFTSALPKKTTKVQQQLSSVKSDCALFSRLYISCQTRDGNLDDFFRHENQGCPPSLSSQGKLRLPKKKSELVDCLIASGTAVTTSMPTVNVTIIDGAVAVNMIRPSKEATFEEYASKSFLPYMEAQSRLVDRIDVVWDVYVENSLKQTTRCNRGAGVRCRISANCPIPRNWSEFLRVDENKSQLFRFLAECLSTLNTGKQVITTCGDQVLCTVQRDVTDLAPCSHEEADTRIMLHVQDAVNHGYNKIAIRTVDTDVLVLAVATLVQLSSPTQPELWLAFGTGGSLWYIAAHTICINLGPRVSRALPVFHAFTGCDTVSCFSGKGKKTAFETWKVYPEVTNAFLLLASTPSEVSDSCMVGIERFTALLYDRTSSKMQVNMARKQLFAQKGRSLDAIPPSRAALVEHTKRAAYQAGHCWGQALTPRPVLPSPEMWGWTLCEGKWEPFWSALPDVTQACRELVRCGCKKGCRGRCSCQKVSLRCTALCSCDEECNNR